MKVKVCLKEREETFILPLLIGIITSVILSSYSLSPIACSPVPPTDCSSLNELCSFSSLCICMSCCSFLLIWVPLTYPSHLCLLNRERQILYDVIYMWSLKYNKLVTITKNKHMCVDLSLGFLFCSIDLYFSLCATKGLTSAALPQGLKRLKCKAIHHLCSDTFQGIPGKLGARGPTRLPKALMRHGVGCGCKLP